MLRPLTSLFFLSLAFACEGCAAPSAERSEAARSSQDCFDIGMVQDYESVDKDTIRVRVGAADKYDVDLGGGQCDQVDWTQRLAIEGRPSSFICTGNRTDQGQITFRDFATRRKVQCFIRDVRKVTDAEPAKRAD